MRIMSNDEIRQMLCNAFHEGRVRGKWEVSNDNSRLLLPSRQPPTFDEWYEAKYDN